MVAWEVLLPNGPAIPGVEAEEAEACGEHVNAVRVGRGRGARAVAAGVAGRSGIAAVVVLREAERGGPKLPASVGIERDANFIRHVFDIAIDQREGLASSDGERTVPIVQRRPPDCSRTLGGPGLEELLRSDTVEVRPAILRPVGGTDVSGKKECQRSQQRRGNQRRWRTVRLHGP